MQRRRGLLRQSRTWKRCQPLYKIRSPRRVRRKIGELKSLGDGRRHLGCPASVSAFCLHHADTSSTISRSNWAFCFLGRSEALHDPGKLLALLASG